VQRRRDRNVTGHIFPKSMPSRNKYKFYELARDRSADGTVDTPVHPLAALCCAW
jgi:hypothetical protein